jgi:hypothetical protein
LSGREAVERKARDVFAEEPRLTTAPAGAGTTLTFTEQAVYLAGYDNPGERERGTRGLLDQLGTMLRR